MTGAGTGAGVAIVVGVRTIESRQNQMGVRRVKCDMVGILLKESMALWLIEVP